MKSPRPLTQQRQSRHPVSFLCKTLFSVGYVLWVNHRYTAEHPGESKHPQLVHKVYRFNTAVSHPLVKGLRGWNIYGFLGFQQIFCSPITTVSILSSIYTLLDKVKGVQTVQNIKIESIVGENYSEFDYDIQGATKNNIVYPSLDPMIFEVKYPNTDIQGRITTL